MKVIKEQVMREDAIGPHEGIEFQLYEQGTKHVILLADDLPLDEAFADAYRLGAEYITVSSDSLLISYIFYRPNHKQQALRLRKLLLEIPQYMGFTREEKIDYERETGQILGYEEWQIEAFIESRFGAD